VRGRHADACGVHRQELRGAAGLMRASRSALLAAALFAALSAPAWAVHWPFIGKAAHKVARAAPANVRVWVTSADQSLLLSREPDLRQRPAEMTAGYAAAGALIIDTHKRYQGYLGVGASLTDASAVAINRSMNPKQRKALMRELFGDATDHPSGLGISFVRVPIGGSDFSQLHYSLDDAARGATDASLAHFRLDPYRSGQVPLLQEARRINPGLLLMASPWSAPAWMKENDSLVGGHLQPRWYGAFADYLVRFSDEYTKLGLPLYAISLQNEPGYDTPDYPGMVVTANERTRLIVEALGPKLAQRKSPPLLLDHDHNWDEPQSPARVLADAAAARYVGGVAWHCYKGHVVAQSKLHDQFPAFDAYMTECSGGGWQKDFEEAMRWFYGEVAIGSLDNWARAVAFWNLALDTTHGPHAGGCKNCRGIVTIDARGHVTRNAEYYALAHVTRCLRTGARHVASTDGPDGIRSVAFRNEDDGSLVLLAYNDAKQTRRLDVRAGARGFEYELPAGTAATFCWQP
jgi:glucosylceramidase